MAEPEELISDAARHATVFARDLWRRHRPPPEAPRTLGLVDVAPRIDLIVTAVFGAGCRIRVAQPPAPPTLLLNAFRRRRGPRVSVALPATDGSSIWLPADLGVADDAAAADLYKALALHQAMRARRGSAALPAADWPPRLADLYLLLEAYACDDALARLLPGIAPSLARLRQTALAARPPLEAFPAAARPLERLVRRMLEHPSDASLVTASPADSLALARRMMKLEGAGVSVPESRCPWPFRFMARMPSSVDFPKPKHRHLPASETEAPAPLFKDWWTGELKPPAAPSETVIDDAAPDDEDAAPPRSARLSRTPDVRDATPHEDDEHDEPGVWMVQGDEPHQHAEDPMGMRRPADRDEETGADELADMVSDLPEARLIASAARPKEVLMSDDAPVTHAKRRIESPAADETRIRYPEWDYRTSAYRDPGVTVHVTPAQHGAQSWVDNTVREHGAMLAAIRRHFEMLRAKRTLLRKRVDGEEIDVDAFVEGLADYRAGNRMPDALYATRRAADRSLAILLLIDVSGSTDGWISTDRRVIDVEREALLLVSIALQSLGERYAVEAFSGHGPQGVTLRSVKRFDEAFGNDVALRIASLEPEHYTRAGAAIRHASALLMREPAAHRLLLLLSDGKPNDVDEYEGRYGAEDMRQAVVEARLQGLNPFCLTIDRHAASYLPRVFGANQYALLTRPERLPTVLLDWMKRLIVA